MIAGYKYAASLTLGLSFALTPVSRLWASTTASLCSQAFVVSKSNDSVFGPVTARDYTLQGIGRLGGSTPQEINEMKAWVKAQTIDGHLKLNEPLAPEAPEHVVYNWALASTNITNITRGIHKGDVAELIKREKLSHYGMYAMSDPASAGHFGEILMEVAVYKDYYPRLTPNGAINWLAVKDWQFSYDPSAGAGAGVNFFGNQAPAFKSESYLIQDLRVIKQLRFPNKKTILGTWFELDFIAQETSLENLVHVAEQWLMTPNYSAAERAAIVAQNPQKFIEYINFKPEASWNTGGHVGYKGVSTTVLRLEGVLKTLFKTEHELVNPRTLQTNYALLAELWKTLPITEKQQLEFIRDNLTESRIKRILAFIIAIETPAFAQEKKALIAHLAQSDQANKVFAFYRKSHLRDDLQAIEAVSLANF